MLKADVQIRRGDVVSVGYRHILIDTFDEKNGEITLEGEIVRGADRGFRGWAYESQVRHIVRKG